FQQALAGDGPFLIEARI
ncbi:MAG: hypothetical protein KDK04_22640, partial [Candidatus Competibacteraceae bacterium]|nr:hypothetical protein [Candidatus Competibacteraceae bacterium]